METKRRDSSWVKVADLDVPQVNQCARKLSKTLDIGENGTSVSTDALGRVLQMSTFHPEHGIVVAAPYDQFNGSKFYDPTYVRKYRARMLRMIQAGQPGFGLRFEQSPKHVSVNIRCRNHALVQFKLQDKISVLLSLKINENGELVQSATISSTSPTAEDIQYTFDLGISVHRASYGQLTEGGPIPLPAPGNHLVNMLNRVSFAIINPNLGAHIEACLLSDGTPVNPRFYENIELAAGPVKASFAASIGIPPNGSKTLTMRIRLVSNLMLSGTFLTTNLIKLDMALCPHREWRLKDTNAMFIVRRNLDYILGNCAIPVSETATALITDHVALPLGWNRDNFWQVRFLLDVYKNIDQLAYADTVIKYRAIILRTLKGHLEWVFHLAERPFGFWHRSYLVTGKPKDGPVFQLDQQCYPLLELCMFFEENTHEMELVRRILEKNAVSQIINFLELKRDPESGLYPTDETPGDDAVEYPFHFSSHVLLWYTILRLVQTMKAVGATGDPAMEKLQLLVEDIHQTILRYFLTTCPKTKQLIFAYLSNGKGQHTFYHDANDLPTLFAFKWGFLNSPPLLEAWKNTMKFALSTDNQHGYFPGGPFGGLGSVHTKGPWPLGYFQEFAFARIMKNPVFEQDSWRRIQGAMLWDGLFSEAVDRDTAECTSKAWFSWPGAVIGSALIEANRETKYFEVQKEA